MNDIPPHGLLPDELWGEWPRCIEIARLFSREGRRLAALVLREYNRGFEVKLHSDALQVEMDAMPPLLRRAARLEVHALQLLLRAQDLRKEADRRREWAELASDSHAERMAINERIWTDARRARIRFAEELYTATMPPETPRERRTADGVSTDETAAGGTAADGIVCATDGWTADGSDTDETTAGGIACATDGWNGGGSDTDETTAGGSA
jgi:hypothetical protein